MLDSESAGYVPVDEEFRAEGQKIHPCQLVYSSLLSTQGTKDSGLMCLME
jgi:hypothetical protein